MADNGVGNFDVVILGAGSGGYACALRAAQLGLSVALVEKGKLGGTCLHVGCIPTKALLHAAEVADSARESEQFGVNATLEGIDMGGVNKYKDGVVSRLFKGLTGLVKGRGITLVEGEGRLVGDRTVEVNGRRYVGRAVVLASGSYSKSLPGLEVDGHRVLTSEHALTLDRVPRSAIVLGGGVIGCEFASVWRSFGAEVTIVEALPRLVAAEDEDVSKTLERAFRKRKIGLRTGSPFQSVESTDDGVRVTVEGGETIEAEVLLVAVGRGPSTGGLGYEEQGVDHGPRLRPHRRAAAHEPARRLRRRRHRPRPPARAPRLPAGHLRGRGHRRARPHPDRRDRHPPGHLLRPRGRLRRAHRGGRPVDVRRRRGGDADLRPRRQRQEPDPAGRRASSSSCAPRTARSSACTWSARGSASSSARPS